MVLGAVIERVTGQPYAEALQKRVFLPAGMIGTGVDDPELILPHRATGYQTNWGLGTARYKYMPSSFSSGSLYSTVEDLYRWNRAIDSGMLVGPGTRRSMFERHLAIDEDFCGYGWFLGDREVGDSTVRVAYHGGDVSGFSAFVLRAVDAGDLVVLLSNQEGLKYEAIVLNILRVLNGLPAEEPREYVADLVRHAVLSTDLDHGLEVYAGIRDRGLDLYNTDEDELVELGYDLMAVDRTADAVGVFQIAVDLHPDSPDAYEGLSEAQLAIGDLEAAAASARKIFELEPGHRRAAEILEEVLARGQSTER
jgi:CubicO group peptidase (beta-lactamase class C family)